MPEYTAREDLLRPVGHFSNGEFTSLGGQLMIRIEVDFEVNAGELRMLNNLTSGIRGCDKILPSRLSKKIVLIVCSLGIRQNPAIAIALAYRTKVNNHLAQTEDASVTSIVAKRGSTDRGGIRPNPYR
jgi:hypothetical protein